MVSETFWNSTPPRILHDVAAFWAIAFWVWAVVYAAITAKKAKKKEQK